MLVPELFFFLFSQFYLYRLLDMLSRSTQNGAIALSRCIKSRINALLRTKHTRSTPNVKLVTEKRYFTNTITKPRQIPQNKAPRTTTSTVDRNGLIQEEQDPIPVEETNDIVADLEAVSESKDINNKNLVTQSMIQLGDFVEIFQYVLQCLYIITTSSIKAREINFTYIYMITEFSLLTKKKSAFI